MKIVRKTALGLLTAALLVSGFGAGAAPAQAVTPAVSDPGPAGDFNWGGFNWKKRFWGGGPQYNGQWSPSNVSNPDANGRLKLSITNPTGSAPLGSEIQSTRRGFGYGTYSTVVEKNINSLQKEVVWGCLFTYDPDSTPGFAEIDLCEASAWGGGAQWGESWPVTLGHGYWFDASKGPGLGNNTVTFPVSSSPVLTHKMVWEPGRITFETYEGEGFAGRLLKRTVVEGSKVPVPAKEYVLFNLWVVGGGGGNPNAVKPESVVIRNFSFTPSVSASVAPKPSAPTTSTTAPTSSPSAATSPSPVRTVTPSVSPVSPSTSNAGSTANSTSASDSSSVPKAAKSKDKAKTVTSAGELKETENAEEPVTKSKKGVGSYKIFPLPIA